VIAKWTKLGSDLSDYDKRHVLVAFVHRYTGQHTPDWARVGTWKDGQPYPVQFKDDAEWLANTRFAVLKSGDLDTRFSECESSPTWPNNPEIRAPKAVADLY